MYLLPPRWNAAAEALEHNYLVFRSLKERPKDRRRSSWLLAAVLGRLVWTAVRR
jgi:hypothetical protein